jgi:cell pole-organizing protein PopZ
MKRLALLALAGVVLAGCGGSSRLSKSAYEQRVQADGNAVQTSVTALTKTPPKTLAELATRVDAAEAVVKKAADDLASLKAPSDAVADNAAVVAALRAIQAGLEKVKTDPTAAATIVGQLESSPQLKAAEKATADLKQKGYKVGVIGAP